MTDLELSTMIEAHVRDLASANGHPLFGRLALKIKVNVKLIVDAANPAPKSNAKVEAKPAAKKKRKAVRR